jgi:predicted dehydrogenase
MEEGMRRIRAGIIGIGNISGIYLENLTTVFSGLVDLAGCADMVPDRAKEAADQWNLEKFYETPEQLLADDSLDLVVNLTNPDAHYAVCAAAIDAGKHVYVEKPLSTEVDDARRLLESAKAQGVRLGGAPDTFLGGGIQTCRKLIDDGWIGRPIGATAFMMCHGHEDWHPSPEFFYKPGAGPLFDMGPYYLTALVNLIGPVRRVSGATQTTFAERTITSEPLRGTTISVETPTHLAGILEFEAGAIGTLVTSFDVWAANVPHIEIYGTEGSLSVPDPNWFHGPVSLRRAGDDRWHEIPLSHGYSENRRGLGVADMCEAILNDRPHRASGELTIHVLEIMHGIVAAAGTGSRYEPEHTGLRPAAFPTAFPATIVVDGTVKQ